MRYLANVVLFGLAVYTVLMILLSLITVEDWQEQHAAYMQEQEQVAEGYKQ